MELKEFIERYNQEVEWSQEVVGEEYFKTIHPFLHGLLGGFVHDEKLSEDNLDTSTARIFEEVNYCELQAYSYKDYHGMYYWIHPKVSEEDFKKDKLKDINDLVLKRLDEIEEQISKFFDEKSELSEFLAKIKR